MPEKELNRLQAVHRFLVLEHNKESQLQEIVELASELFEAPVALITLMDKDIQYFKFKVGAEVGQNERENTFCQYLMDGDEVIEIQDALNDLRFKNNPIVSNAPFVRFYAGAPLITHDHHSVGSLCILDVKPKKLSCAQKHLLKVLANWAIMIMEFDLSLEVLKGQYIEAKGAEIKLRSFFESVGGMHLLIGKELDVMAFNKKMEDFIKKIYGVKLFEGIKVSEIIKGKQYNRFVDEYKQALYGISVKYEREVDHKGQRIWWQVSFEPGYNAENKLVGVSYNAIDITERKIQEKQIIDQNESLKQIAYIQSHEMRKPVASLLGFMELFKANNYTTTKEELLLMEQTLKELDNKIRTIVDCTDGTQPGN